MERIGIAGLSLHETDVRGLERLDRPRPEELGERVRAIADEIAASEVVLIATCNRVELIFAREVGHLPCRADVDALANQLGLAESDSLRGLMHLRGGRDAVRYLFRVASSLDSLVVGEDQILGQVRDAFEASRGLGMTGALLSSLFEQALHVGKRVRTETELSRHPVSVVSLGLSAVAQRFEHASDGCPPRLALVGTGHMAEIAATGASRMNLPVELVVGRTPERVRALAKTAGARAVDLEHFRSGAERVDALISATSAAGYVLDAAALDRIAGDTPSGLPLLGVDLAVPRDLEPAGPAVEIVDLDALRSLADENRARRAEAAARAEELVEGQVEVFASKNSARVVSSALAELRSETEEILQRELDALFVDNLHGVDEEQRRAIERWARLAFGRLSHAPISAIKRLAKEMSSPGAGAAENEGEEVVQ